MGQILRRPSAEPQGAAAAVSGPAFELPAPLGLHRPGALRAWAAARQRPEVALACTLGGLSLAVTLARALGYALWQDEVGAARIVVARSFGALLAQVTARENHPPGYHVLGWLVHRLGVPAVDVRGLSVTATVLLTVGVVLFAARVLPLRLAALAGLLTALSWQVVRHGWELRPYALLALASLGAAAFVERAAADPRVLRLTRVGVVVAVGCLLHVYFVFTVAACVAWLLLWAPARSRARVLTAIAVGLAPLGVWAPRFLQQYGHRHFETLPRFSVSGVTELYARLLERSLPSGAGGLAAGAAVLALVALGASRLWRDPGRGRLCALAAVVPLVAASMLWLAGPPVVAPRALVGALPFVVVCLAAAVEAVPRPVEAAAAVGVAALALLGFSRSQARIVPRYDGVAAALVASGWRPQDPIVLLGPLYEYLDPLDWYLPGDARLAPAVPAAGSCQRAFVVAVGAAAHALVRREGGGPVRRVGGVLVVAGPWRDAGWAEAAAAGGSVLGTREAGCLVPRWDG